MKGMFWTFLYSLNIKNVFFLSGVNSLHLSVWFEVFYRNF
jgi:hypothetical protein